MNEPFKIDTRRSISRHMLAGLVIVLVLAGGVGGWAGTMTLSGALIAPGQIVVDTNVKKVQHPTGGIVGELLSPVVVKFAIAYFCLVNTLAMVAVWTPLIVKSFSADASNRTIGLLAAIPQICTIIAIRLQTAQSQTLDACAMALMSGSEKPSRERPSAMAAAGLLLRISSNSLCGVMRV